VRSRRRASASEGGEASHDAMTWRTEQRRREHLGSDFAKKTNPPAGEHPANGWGTVYADMKPMVSRLHGIECKTDRNFSQQEPLFYVVGCPPFSDVEQPVMLQWRAWDQWASQSMRRDGGRGTGEARVEIGYFQRTGQIHGWRSRLRASKSPAQDELKLLNSGGRE
jgi:hypothetical protein